MWVSSVINPQTFFDAGTIGANILCSVFGQTWEELGSKIWLHNQSLAYHGFSPSQRTVTCLVHTFLGASQEAAVSCAHQPLADYLLQSIELTKLQMPDLALLPESDLASIAATRFVKCASLIGSVLSCHTMVTQIVSVGIGEIACLVDFGVSATDLLTSLGIGILTYRSNSC